MTGTAFGADARVGGISVAAVELATLSECGHSHDGTLLDAKNVSQDCDGRSEWGRPKGLTRRGTGAVPAEAGDPGRSQPRAQLAFQQRRRVRAAHQPQHVQQVRDRRGLPVPGLPQVQYLIGGTGFHGEIVYVPVVTPNKKRL